MTDGTLPTRQLKQTSQDKQNVYERHALRPNSNTIRVLDVQPIPKDAIEGTPVNCTLRVIHLDRDPDFTALSYVWGDPEHKRSIVCDGVLFPVTENCYSALWNLSKKLQGLVIWVDAICINQEKTSQEKEWQIPLMGDIYTKAQQVYIWLGRADDRSDRVMRYMSRGGLRAFVQTALDEPPRYRPYVAALRSSFAGLSFGYHPLPFQHLEWALLLLRSTSGSNFPKVVITWESIAFDRGKISSAIRPAEPNVLHSLQEHEGVVRKVLAARRTLKITWVCFVLACLTAALLVGVVGTCSTEIPELGIKFRFDYSTELVYMMLTVGAIPGTVFYAWMEVRDFFNPFRRDLDDTGSDTLVGALYQRAATNSKDMAYGIWAILPKIGASVLPKPAYDADDGTQIPLVYWQLTVSLLQMTGNSRILFIAATRRMQNTPSWVPDWSTFKSNAWRDLPGFPGTDLLRGHPRISPETKEMVKKERAHQRVSIDPTQRILSVLAEDTGAICGCVSFQSTSKTFEALERNSHLQNMRSMLQWASWAENIGCKVSGFFFPPPNHELALEVTPLSAGATSPGWRDRTQWEKLLRKPRRDKLNIYLTRWMDGVKVPRWFLKFMSTQIYLCTLFAELKRKICYVSISDEPGKFRLLVCSAETQVNDRLIRLCGLPSPMVMRKHGELANSVSIISPTALQGQGARRKSKSRNEGSEISLENQFVEYHIH
ncbi:HET-like protein [Alternaria alternata]|nr:HET-like protein [Alternaria alternata]